MHLLIYPSLTVERKENSRTLRVNANVLIASQSYTLNVIASVEDGIITVELMQLVTKIGHRSFIHQ